MPYDSAMWKDTVPVRQRASSASPGADVTYSTAVNVIGNWEEETVNIPAQGGGWQKGVRQVLITAGRISGTQTYLVLTRDDKFFRPGSDATNEDNGHVPKGFFRLTDADQQDALHHYEITF